MMKGEEEEKKQKGSKDATAKYSPERAAKTVNKARTLIY
jgi:hypothetical protein